VSTWSLAGAATEQVRASQAPSTRRARRSPTIGYVVARLLTTILSGLDSRPRDPEVHHREHRGHRGRKERVSDPDPNPSFLLIRLCDLCGEIRGKPADCARQGATIPA
jgi:hypothetical protein